MNLRNRALLLLGLTFIVFIIIIAAVSLSVTLSGLDRMEHQDMAEAVDRELGEFASSPEVRKDPGMRRRVASLRRERDRVWHFLRRSLDRMELNVLVNVFSEIEQASIETGLDPLGTSTKIGVDGEQRLVFSEVDARFHQAHRALYN